VSAERTELVLGTRGSELALAQARMAEKALRKNYGIETRLEIIRTTGDEQAVIPAEVEGSRRTASESLDVARDDGRKGLFTAELERALTDKRIDVAVHSAKDLPSEMDPALVIAAVLPRGAAEDLLITKRPGVSSFAVIATGSIRRQRQVRWLKDARAIVDLRGNVPTRLRKFAASNWDAIVLARAGLERLGFSTPEFEFEMQKFFAEVLPTAQFVPAGGQGIIALQTRIEDVQFVSPVDHAPTHLCLRAEREFLRLLQGDCNLPVGVHARFVDDEIELLAQLFGKAEEPRMAGACGEDPEELARKVFGKIDYDHEHEHE
jgi:hydroxymethylbilane synthase